MQTLVFSLIFVQRPITCFEMSKNSEIAVKDVLIRTMTKNGTDYICITVIARQKNFITHTSKGSNSTPDSANAYPRKR